MRVSVILLCLALSACMTPTPSAPVQRSTLTPADAATGIIAGGPLTMSVTTASAPANDDPLIQMTLARADGRTMGFNEANHAPYDVMAQAAGGPLAQVMGLFAGDERPMLYAADASHNSGAPFICAPDGPAYVGYYVAADGSVTMVGLKSGFEFETLSDGSNAALPFSPDHVCARLHFTRQ